MEEKNIANKKPVESKPVRCLLSISDKNFIRGPLFFSPGITSLMIENNWLMNAWEIGRCGINVNRKMTTGGIVIVKLKAMADALSVKPVSPACRKKNLITPNNGIPWKPGRKIFLLFLIRKLTGGETKNLLCSCVSQCMQFIWYSVYSILAGIAGQTSYVPRSWL